MIQRAGREILAFDLRNGELKWKAAVDGAGTRNSSSPIVWRAPGGKEYILHEGGSVYCIDAQNGDIAWRIPVGGRAEPSQPAVST